jgi:hypothetical protein
MMISLADGDCGLREERGTYCFLGGVGQPDRPRVDSKVEGDGRSDDKRSLLLRHDDVREPSLYYKEERNASRSAHEIRPTR